MKIKGQGSVWRKNFEIKTDQGRDAY